MAERKAPQGKDFRVKAQHPRRPGPLRISRKDGTLLAESGQTCEHATAEELASLIENGYVEPASARRLEDEER